MPRGEPTRDETMKKKPTNAAIVSEPSSHDKKPPVSILEYTSLGTYFHEKLSEVRHNQSFQATEFTEVYVLGVLDTFADAERFYRVSTQDGRRHDEALAMILQRAVSQSGSSSIRHYRRLGDLALFIAGIFADSLARSAVGVGYYIDMGRGAYQTLASVIRGQGGEVFRDLYGELADSFAGWVEVLRELSENIGLSRPLSTIDAGELYERWARLSGRQAQRMSDAMVKRGMLPLSFSPQGIQ